MKTKHLQEHTGVSAGQTFLKSLPGLVVLLLLAGPLRAQLTESVNLQKRGLNYVSATQKLAKRLEASGGAFTNGADQPATFTISGIPAGAVIEKAIVWAGTSGNGAPVTLTIQNPAAATTSVPMTLIGSGVDVCWGYTGSYSYRADVTSAISGNGNYLISGLPTDPTRSQGNNNDTDGATLFIIYSDNTASYKGTLVIKDGLVSDEGSVNRTQSVGNFTAPATTMNAKVFSLFLDVQSTTDFSTSASFTMNGTNSPFTPDFWNFVENTTTLSSGQTSAAYNFSSSGGDCVGWVVAGLYYQEVSTLPTADLSITKTDGVSTATPGGSVTYTITASNAGPGNVTGATVADTYPAGIASASWTCVGAGGGTCTAAGSGNLNDLVNLPSGGSVTYTVTANISPSATGSLTNTATITAPGGVSDPTPGNNSATDTDNLAPSADLSITKTDGVSTVTPGGSVTYTITASNSGPSNVTGATVADTYPAGIASASWTCVGAGGGTCTAAGSGNLNDLVNLPSGGSVTYTVTANISPSATGSLTNTATITAPGGVSDPTPGNNSATDTDNLAPSADLSITKTDGVSTVTPGGSVTYTITASNSGPSNVTGATVADTYPAGIASASWTCVGAGGGTCTAAGSGNLNDLVNLPSGGSVTYTVTANISASATGTLSNTATVAAPGGVSDPAPGNNSATDTDNLAPSADLSITKTDGVSTVTPGGSVTYTITASNSGPSNVTGATVADTYPAGIASASWTCVGAGGGTCTAAGSGNLNDLVNLPSGGSVTYTVSATLTAGSSGTLSNTATVAAPGGVTDPAPGNNSATDTDNIVCPNIMVQASGNTSVILGYGGLNSNCTTLNASASGGSGTYSYTWEPGGLSGQNVQVCPTQTTTYTVTATDQASGCTGSTTITVNVQDVRCGPQNKNVAICYYGVTQCVNEKTAKNYLKLGATLGPCTTGNARISYEETSAGGLILSLQAYPNPTTGRVNVLIESPTKGRTQFEIVDTRGRAVVQKAQELVEGTNEIDFDLSAQPAGIYLIRAVDALGQQATVRVHRQ